MESIIRLGFSIFIIALTVQGDGEFCTQSGIGPSDMMMSNGNMNPKYMWGKSGGKVRVAVVLDHAYDHKERDVIFGGLAEMASKTCVKFLVYKHPEEVHDGDYVYITKSKGKGCWSYVGKQGGHQDLSLPVGCINHRTVMHEMMHALGFSHEHVRADRDKFVQILWENIQRGRERNFERKRDSKSDNFGPYDYESIMHYDNRAFSSNGHDTIQPTQGFVRIGRGKRMSHWDSKKINRAYKCHQKGSYGHSDFGGYGHTPVSPDNSPPIRFALPEHSYRTSNPFLAGPPPRHHNHHHSNNNNAIDHEDADADYSPFGPPPPFYMDHHGNDNSEDYYHP